MGQETALERLQYKSKVLPGYRNRDEASGWIQALSRRLGQGWGRPQVSLIRAFKVYECPQGTEPLWVHQIEALDDSLRCWLPIEENIQTPDCQSLQKSH